MGLPTPKPGTGLMTIAFDLDGTLAEATWPSPEIGAPIQSAVDAAIAYRKQGYELIVHTSRPHSHSFRIWDWLNRQGLKKVFYDVVCGKPRACLYVDDRSAVWPESFSD